MATTSRALSTYYIPAAPGGLMFEHLYGLSEQEAWYNLLQEAGYRIMSREANDMVINHMKAGGWTVEAVAP